MDNDLARATLEEASAALQRGDVSPTELLDAVLERCNRLNPDLNAFVTVLEGSARERAKQLEQQPRAARARQPLWGVPVSVKDNIAVVGAPTTAGSCVPLANDTNARNAAVTESLLSAGAVVFAKTRLYEFAFGNQHRAHGVTKNPWRFDRTTAGSSSGSVAAVAASLGFGSIGTDTGGSIRVPAAMCGVVGMKPTFGRVSTRGVVPVSWSLDHVGPIARTVGDVAAMLQAMSPAAAARRLEEPPRRIGIAFDDHTLLDGEVRAALRDALEVLSDTYQLVDVHLPDAGVARTVLWTIASAEASDYHRHLLAQYADHYDPLVRRRLLRGRLLSAADYVRAQRLRAALTSELDAATAKVDAVVLPVSPVSAYSLADRRVEIGDVVEDASDAVTRFTPLFSLTGWPALSVPCGHTAGGLPIGLQVAARSGHDELALAVAQTYEHATRWHELRPPESAA